MFGVGFFILFSHIGIFQLFVYVPIVAKPVKQCYREIRERNWGRERKYGKSDVNAINERKINLHKLDKLMWRI